MKSILLIACVLLLAGCIAQQQAQAAISTPSGLRTVNIELATTPVQWEQGLMNRPSLGENEGMLFVFPDSQKRSFWMKNTQIPLDMLFISENYEITDMTTMQPCTADPCPVYTSKAPARFVLEVNAGYAERYNITLGDKMAFKYVQNSST